MTTRPPATGPAPNTGAASSAPSTPQPSPTGPLSEQELETLQDLLDSLPDTLQPLDVVMVDGYLCGVLLQPDLVAPARWLTHIADVDGRAPPKRFNAALMASLVQRRHAELGQAIKARQWFDPWVYQLDDEASPSETVLPWVAGFAAAVELFPTLMARHEGALLEPLATLYRHLDPDDLEDADELLAEIETLAPPETLAEAVEDLVRSVLLIADVALPAQATAAPVRPRHPMRSAARPQSAGPRSGRAAAPAKTPRRGPAGPKR